MRLSLIKYNFILHKGTAIDFREGNGREGKEEKGREGGKGRGKREGGGEWIGEGGLAQVHFQSMPDQ